MIGQLVLARAVLGVSRVDLAAAGRAACARRGLWRRVASGCIALFLRLDPRRLSGALSENVADPRSPADGTRPDGSPA